MHSLYQKFKRLNFHSWWASFAAILSIPLIFLFMTEWVARSSSPEVTWKGLFSSHFMAILLGYGVLVLCYTALLFLTKRHWAAALFVGALSNVMAIATYYKMQYRGEPLLPWDLAQLGALAGIGDKLDLQLPISIAVSVLCVLLLVVFAGRIHLPALPSRKKEWIVRAAVPAVCAGLLACMVNNIYLNEGRLQKMQIWKISWKTAYELNDYGVMTTFLQNLQSMMVRQPEIYTANAAEEVLLETEAAKQPAYLLNENGAPVLETDATVQQPDIIFYMSEGFWDIRRLTGIEYEDVLFKNLTALQNEGVYGYTLSPSYGGGTCNAEFEALTGYSMKFLPNGSIPYVSYINSEVPTLPSFLKTQGYETMALHTYLRSFWNRDKAYVDMGIDEYYAQESFENPELSRGYISDMELARRIESELSSRQSSEQPLFMHVVSMQNHTGYDPQNFLPEELVGLTTDLPISQESLGKLQDCATGLQQADAALGYLTQYLKSTDRPTILVFWGDHVNSVGVGTELQDVTGYSTQHEGASMNETPFLIWSNYANTSLDLGTVSIYNLAPVMMDLYQLQKPLYFDFLLQQFTTSRGSAVGFLSDENGDCAPWALASEEQSAFIKKHFLLQYDQLNGNHYLKNSILQNA